MLSSIKSVDGVGLRELFPRARFIGASDIRVTACTADSRRCQPGDLFVALVGTRHDGHDYARSAVALGANAILSERPLAVPGVPVCVVPDTRAALGQLCQLLVGHPARRLQMVGITGTNGKTTTTALTASVLQAAGCRVGTLGTLGYCDSLESVPGVLTTPGAAELASWLARMEACGCSHAVMEVSSHALSQSRTAGIEFDIACLTNVRRDHLDFHGSPIDYRKAKARLFEQLAPEGLVVLNVDDPGAAGFLKLLHGPVLTVSLTGEAAVTATVVERCKSEQTFLLSAGADTVPVRTAMIGDHNVSNCLVAAAVGLTYGIDLSTIAQGLERVGHVSGRLERIECGQEFGVFVDFAHTPDALAVVLETLREVTRGRLICVFGAGGDRDREKRPLMGRAVFDRTDLAIVTNDNPRHEDPASIAAQVLSGRRADDTIEVELDRAAAIQRALSLAEPGDCVLLAGKGHENYQTVGSELRPFDDREIARRWLYNLAPGAQSWDGPACLALGNS